MVELLKMGTQAEVIAVNKDGSLQLQAGILKITAKQDEVRVVEDAKARRKKQQKQQSHRAMTRIRAAGVKPELDLRGMMSDEALDTVDRYLDDLACGVANIVNIFFPEVIALSGGVANQGDTLLVPLRERVRALSYGSRYAVRHTRIELCTLGYRAGVIGAALLLIR